MNENGMPPRPQLDVAGTILFGMVIATLVIAGILLLTV
jgi:hypothetical protein